MQALCRTVLAHLVATGIAGAQLPDADEMGPGPPSSESGGEDGAAAGGGGPRKRLREDGGGCEAVMDAAHALATGRPCAVVPRSAGRGIASAYLRVESACRLLALPYSAGFRLMLERAAACAEVLDGIPVRRDDKKRLNALNAARTGACRFRCGGKIQTPEAKAVVLLQAAMARAAVGDARLEQDARMLTARAERTVFALSSLASSADVRSPAAVNSRVLARSLAARCWHAPASADDVSFAEVRQLSAVLRDGPTDAAVAAWAAAGVSTLRDFLDTTPQRLAELAPRCQGVVRAAAAAQASLAGVIPMLVRVAQAGDSAVDVTLEPSGDWPVPDPARSAATPPRLAEFELFVCRNAPGGLCERRTVRGSPGAQTLRVRLRDPLRPTMVQLANAAGLRGLVAEAPGNPNLVFVHLLHRSLVGLDWYAQLDTATGRVRSGPFAQSGVVPRRKAAPKKAAGTARGAAAAASSSPPAPSPPRQLSARELLGAIEAAPVVAARAKRRADPFASLARQAARGDGTAAALPPPRPRPAETTPARSSAQPTPTATPAPSRPPSPPPGPRSPSVASSVGGRSLASMPATKGAHRGLRAFARLSERFSSHLARPILPMTPSRGISPGLGALPSSRPASRAASPAAMAPPSRRRRPTGPLDAALARSAAFLEAKIAFL